MGFREDLEFILKTTPAEPPHPAVLGDPAARHCRAGQAISEERASASRSTGSEGGHADIEYRAIRVAAHDVEHAVVNVLRFF